MGQKFHASVHQREEVAYVKVAGVIDEDNELSPLADQIAGKTAIIDLGEIDRINSCGVRDWVNWLGRVERGGQQVVLVECSPAIVAQINLVHNFTGAGVVKSFYAPYYCPSCDREKVLLVEARDFAGQAGLKAPSCRCDECDGPMTFDDMEESYFAFLANAAKIATDAQVDAVLGEFTPPPDGGDRKLRGRTGITGPGAPAPTPQTSAGSLPSVPSLPSLPRTPSGSGNTSQRWPLLSPDELTRRPLPPTGRPAGAWIVVGLLVATALALLAYVFLTGPRRSADAPATSATRVER